MTLEKERKEYPQHDRMIASQIEAKAIQKFLRWLAERGVALAPMYGLHPDIREVAEGLSGSDRTLLLHTYFGIDPVELHRERVEIAAGESRAPGTDPSDPSDPSDPRNY